MRRILEIVCDILLPPSRALRAFDSRPAHDDHEFYRRHFAGTGVDEQITVRLRAVIVKQLGRRWSRVIPSDIFHDVDDELDFVELLHIAEEEFDIKVSSDKWSSLDGSFESLVRCIAAAVAAKNARG